jgi:Domain of unknown function (DUF4259)
MVTWSPLPFGNDDAAEWAYDLDEPDDLQPIAKAIAEVLAVGDEELEAFEASAAVAAIELLACLGGHPGDMETYTEAAHAWVTATKVKPPVELVDQAHAALDRVLAERSELRELWQQSDEFEPWLAELTDLRRRVSA